MVHKCKTKLSQSKLENYISVLIRCISSNIPIHTQFSVPEIIEILHHGIDLFANEPILLEFSLAQDGLIVVGNLHGSIHSLLRTFQIHGLPPIKRYLFLGGYVGHGNHQLEIIVLLLLMKIRWPEYIILLRGSPETMEATDIDDVPTTSRHQLFAEVCRSQLPSPLDMCFLFNQMFDMMPVAAVLSGCFLCCYGGISQWMTCFQNIRDILRPTFAKKMKFLEACLLADILHAQPNPIAKKPFEASTFGLGYVFNRDGLQLALDALKLTTLIRTDEKYDCAVTRNFNDDSCYTILTASDPHDSSSTTLEIICNNKVLAIQQAFQAGDKGDTLAGACGEFIDGMTRSSEQKFIERSRSHPCRWCMDVPPSDFDLRARFYTHFDLDVWVKKYASDWAQADEIFMLNENLHRANPTNRSYEERRIQRSAELFPSFYDLRALDGGDTIRGGTFRLIMNDDDDEHQQFMITIYPHSEYLFDRVPFSVYNSRDIDNDSSESDVESRNERMEMTCVQRVRTFCHRKCLINKHLENLWFTERTMSEQLMVGTIKFELLKALGMGPGLSTNSSKGVNMKLTCEAALNPVLPRFERGIVDSFEMKRGSVETSACAGQECGDLQSEGKRAKQNCLLDRLYFNRVVDLPDHYNANAFSFSELLEHIAPVASIHFNFMIDLRWLLAQYPGRLRQGPITLIVGERMGTDFTLTKTAVKQCAVNNVNVGRARLMIPFGTHHSKISIFESSTGRVHIIISTANLLEHDWKYKTQAFYHCSGSELVDGDSSYRNGSDFQIDLVKYLNEYRTSQDWNLIEHWRDRVANIDLSHVKARVVYSVPGAHKGIKLTKYGHPRLRVILKELFGDVEMDDFTYHAQFSSLGSLGATPQHWLTGQFLNSLSGGAETDGRHLRIIYPCVEDVRNSNEGYEAGGSLPYSNSVAVKQPYLINFMHKWRSDHLGRSHAMPHVKTYAAFAKNSLKPSWLLVTSANLSKAAWGDYQLKKTQLTIRSYEFGVLFIDPESLDMLPYDLPLTKYDDNDRVWIVDKTYRKPDIFQKTWPSKVSLPRLNQNIAA
uniref:Serine/threonine specific protein phosphatases domain-containing protein n=1 Tax=Setaria digitata TaxID=48799 RepID=A0A915Q5A1_9BILA